ncbi:BRO family protein [Bilophila wadsworthia]|uniref:BRO family protein n=1 Tax=Bilophila wadsworthia TaxID=35833 RepID=UPI0032BFFFA1
MATRNMNTNKTIKDAGDYRMGYTVDKKTGKIILVHDVTVSSKAVKQPETQQQQRQQEQQTAATLPAIPAASMSSARASAPGTFVFPVTRQKVRTVWHEGNVWFVANDVSACLGFARPEKAIIDHCNHAKTLKGPESGGLTSSPRGINIIPESDVYRLVMRSKLPAAEQFQTWVCEEVLPSIRKTGGYGGSPAPATKPQTEDQLILEAMQVLLSRTETLKAELAEAKPKADYYDALVDSRDLLTPTEAAKLFDMPARKLTAFLREKPHKWLFKGFDGANIPYQPIIDRGLMKVKHRTSSLNGMPCTQGYFTPKGIEALRKLLKA